LVITTGMAEV